MKQKENAVKVGWRPGGGYLSLGSTWPSAAYVSGWVMLLQLHPGHLHALSGSPARPAHQERWGKHPS